MRYFTTTLLLALFMLTAQPVLAETTLISGTIISNSQNVTAGWVELSGNGQFMGEEISNGQYQLTDTAAWPSGTYTLLVIPDTETYPTISPFTTTVNYTGIPVSQNVTLDASAKRIAVSVTDADGQPASVEVKVRASGGGQGMSFQGPTNNGSVEFVVRPEGAPYRVTVDSCILNSDQTRTCIPWVNTGAASTVEFTLDDSVAETQTVSIQGSDPTATISGNITYEGAGFEGYINLYNDEHLFSGWMNSSGDFTVYAVPGSYKVDLLPKQSQSNPDVVRYYIDEGTIGGAIVAGEGTTDVGNLAASLESATIHANIVDDAGNPLEGVVVNFWLAGGGEWREITLMPGSAGSTGSEAHAGTYYVNAIDPTGQYLAAPAQRVEVTDNSEPEVSLVMARTNATVNITLDDADGNQAADYNSYVDCWDETNQRGNGTEIVRGSASLELVAGDYTCTVIRPQNADSSVAPVELTVTADAISTETFTAVANDATLSGAVLDQNEDPITPNPDSTKPLTVILEGEIFGRFEVPVETDGTWFAQLPADTYTLATEGEAVIDFQGDAVETVAVAAGATITGQAVPAQAPDGNISATVLAPGGDEPLPFVAVTCSYIPEGQKGDFAGGKVVTVTGETDADGAVTLPVLQSDGTVNLTYNCGVGTPEDEGYIAPATKALEPGADATFTMFDTNATVTVAYDATETLDNVQCQAWNEAGTTMVTAEDTDQDGEVTLDVSRKADKTWQVACTGEANGEWFTVTAPEEVTIPKDGTVDAEVNLKPNDIAIPEGSSQSFDGSGDHSVTLDGVKIEMPANTVETDGDVTLTVTPTATNIPTNKENQVFGVPLNFQAFDDEGIVQTSFAEPMVVTMSFDATAVLDAKVLETDLVPKYLDETSGAWKVVEGFSLDPSANTITFSTDHFTQFALVYDERIAGEAPNKVKDVRVPKKNIDETKAKVSWKTVSTAETYQIQVFTKAGKKIKTIKNVTDKAYTLKKIGLKADKRYKVRVRAVGSNGLYGTWSKYTEFRTDAN